MLGKLQGQQQGAPEIADITDLHDVGVFAGQQEVARDALLE